MNKTILTKKDIGFFEENGYLIVPELLSSEEIKYYRDVYEDFLSNRIDTNSYRSDLGGHVDKKNTKVKELITQIMVPSRLLPSLTDKPLHQKSSAIARELMGEDMALDFDMLIDKAPHTNTATPWHQDRAY